MRVCRTTCGARHGPRRWHAAGVYQMELGAIALGPLQKVDTESRVLATRWLSGCADYRQWCFAAKEWREKFLCPSILRNALGIVGEWIGLLAGPPQAAGD